MLCYICVSVNAVHFGLVDSVHGALFFHKAHSCNVNNIFAYKTASRRIRYSVPLVELDSISNSNIRASINTTKVSHLAPHLRHNLTTNNRQNVQNKLTLKSV